MASPTEMTDCIAIIRSLVLIRKQITTLRDINFEYKAMEGENIPYAKFGYKSLEDFLQASNQFNLIRQAMGQTIISTRLSANDEHMAKLVQETRSKTHKPTSAANRFSSTGLRRPTLAARPAFSGFRPPTYVNRQMAPMYRPRHAAPTPQFVRPTYPGPQQQTQRPAWTPLPVDQMPRHPIRRSDEPLLVRTVEVSKPQSVEKPRSPVRAPQSTPAHPRIDQATAQPQLPGNDLRNVLNARAPRNRFEAPPLRPRFSVKDRLLVARDSSVQTTTTTGDSGILSDSSRSSRASVEHDLASLSLSQSSDPEGDLIAFCDAHGIERPQLQSYCRKVVGCRLTVQGRSYFEYGQDEPEAKRKVAQTALHYLRRWEQRKAYPVAKMDNHELALRLHEVLLGYPQGVLEKSVPECFQAETGLSLPNHWTDVVAAYNRFFFLDSSSLAHVIYANDVDKTNVVADAPLELPWHLPQWGVYVTHVMSANMIWARLIGPEFSERLDKLSLAVEEQADALKPVTEAVEAQLYLALWEGALHRIRVQEMDPECKRAKCFFVDLGHTQWLAIDTLRICEPQFQMLPGQAQPLSLFGLENMEENPHAKKILEERLLRRALVAEVVTRAADHQTGSPIRCVLYDTSGSEDVNLAETLHREICAAGKSPQLNGTAATQVVVTAVTDKGEVYFQVPGSGLEYVLKAVDRLKAATEKLEPHRGLREDCGDSPTRYLVKDRASGNWYRATMRVRNPQTKCHIFDCIDFGMQVEASEQDVYHLEPLSKALSVYPAMAVRCELFDVPKMDHRTVSRVKGLLEPGSLALAKLMLVGGHSTLPKVNIYQRLGAGENKVIVCVNDTLRLEHDFEQSFDGAEGVLY